MLSNSEIRRMRLQNQLILNMEYMAPEQIVRHLGAMQAQEYAMSKWAIGLRLGSVQEEEVECSISSGKILRTHILRPTWHFVAPEDIRWILALSAPQVHAANGYMYRKTELDSDLRKITRKVIEKAFNKEETLTREQLAEKLLEAGIAASGHRLSYIMMDAELEGIICSGARSGKKFTYTLLNRIVPKELHMDRNEMLSRLAERYFSSRGPASIHDFSCWSGLGIKDARIGAALLDGSFTKDGDHIFQAASHKKLNKSATFLMPDYDEYCMSYKNREAILPYLHKMGEVSQYSHWLVVDGEISGTWQVENKNKRILATAEPFKRLDVATQQKVVLATERYNRFWE